MGTDETIRRLKLLVVRPLDQHASRAIAPAPYDDRPIARVSEVQTLQRLRALIFGRNDRGRTLCQGPCGQHDASGGGNTGLQESTTRLGRDSLMALSS